VKIIGPIHVSVTAVLLWPRQPAWPGGHCWQLELRSLLNHSCNDENKDYCWHAMILDNTVAFVISFEWVLLNAMSWLRRLVISLSLHRPRSIHVGFVVGKVALGTSSLTVLQFSLSIILPCLSITHITSKRWTNKPIGCHSSETVSPTDTNKSDLCPVPFDGFQQCTQLAEPPPMICINTSVMSLYS
jgi:hypothetical protein